MKFRSEAGGRRSRAEKLEKSTAESVKIPVDPINEVVLIAAVSVLLGRDPAAAKSLLQLVPSDAFYAKGHSEIWAALQELGRQCLQYDPATLRQVSAGNADSDLVDQYLQLRPEPPPNLKHHVERVKWDRARVQVVQGPLTGFLDALKDQSADPAKVRALARMVSGAFDGFGEKRYLRDPQNLVAEQDRVLTERREGRAIFPYGVPALDRYGREDRRVVDGDEVSIDGEPRMVPGARPGDVTTIVGTSGGGKTSVTAAMILAQYKLGRRVLYGAWEQGSGMTLELLAAISLGWSRTDLLVGRYSKEDQAIFREEMERIGSLVRFFELPFGRTRGERHQTDRNFDLIQEHIELSGCDLFVADLLHLAITEHDYGIEGDALYRMKAISLEQRCHTIQLQQLALKNTERGEDQRPTRANIKGVDQWIGASDNVLGLYLPALFKSVPNDKIEIHVLKQRYGIWPQAVECAFDPEFAFVGEGRTIEYARPGEQSGEGDLLASTLTRRSRFGGGKKAR